MRFTKIEISEKAIKHNITKLKEYSNNSEIICVVKSNAYGLGIHIIYNELIKLGINRLAVAFVNEALELRELGFKGRILIMVPIFPDFTDLAIKYDLEICLQSASQAEEVNTICDNLNVQIKAHLFFDTGMHRDGIESENLNFFLDSLINLKNLKIIGLMTHFAESENLDEFSIGQIKQFEKMTEVFFASNYFKNINQNKDDICLHFSNSNAIFNNFMKEIKFKMNAIRPGLSIYGFLQSEEKTKEFGLNPVFTLKSKVINIKSILKGETAGYSFKYIADRNHKIALVPIGYGDGYKYNLGNKSEVLICGKRYKVIGSVCMDQIIVNLKDDDIIIGEEVVLLGKQLYKNSQTGEVIEDEVTIYELSKLANTIPYEILTSFTKRIPRFVCD